MIMRNATSSFIHETRAVQPRRNAQRSVGLARCPEGRLVASLGLLEHLHHPSLRVAEVCICEDVAHERKQIRSPLMGGFTSQDVSVHDIIWISDGAVRRHF